MSRIVEITLLTQAHCTFCDRAKEILDRVGREYPLKVREVDLASAEGQRLAADRENPASAGDRPGAVAPPARSRTRSTSAV